MQNYMVLDPKTLQTPYGILGGVDSFLCHPNGELLGVSLSEKNMIVTQAGELIPAYTENGRRKRSRQWSLTGREWWSVWRWKNSRRFLLPLGSCQWN